MNKLLAVAALSLVSMSVGVGCSNASGEDVANSEAHVEASTLVYDHDAPVAIPTVDAAEAKLVLTKLYPGGYLADFAACNGDGDGKSPRIAPTVDGKIQGSFTSGGRNETLYIVSAMDCDVGHADGYGTTQWVVTEPLAAGATDVKIYANATIQGIGASVNRTLDLDKDGQLELVQTGGYAGMGVVTEGATLVRFAGSNLAEDPAFKEFSTKLGEELADYDSPFFYDSCASGFDKSLIAFSKIRATSATTFVAQKGTLSCPPEEK